MVCKGASEHLVSIHLYLCSYNSLQYIEGVFMLSSTSKGCIKSAGGVFWAFFFLRTSVGQFLKIPREASSLMLFGIHIKSDLGWISSDNMVILNKNGKWILILRKTKQKPK